MNLKALMLGSGLLIASLGCTGLVGVDPVVVSAPIEGTELLVAVDLPSQIAQRVENDARKLQLLLGSDAAVVLEGERRLLAKAEVLERRIRPTILDDYGEADRVERGGTSWRVFDASDALVAALEDHTMAHVSGVIAARLGAMGLAAWGVERGDDAGVLRVRLPSDVDVALIQPVLTRPGRLAIMFADPAFPDERVATLIERASAQLPEALRGDRDQVHEQLRDEGSIPPSHVVVWHALDAARPPQAYLARREPLATDVDVVGSEIVHGPSHEALAEAIVRVQISERAARDVAEASRLNLGGRLLVIVDGDVRMASVIDRPVEGAWTELSLGQGPAAAREAVVYAAVFEGGRLDVPLSIASISEF